LQCPGGSNGQWQLVTAIHGEGDSLMSDSHEVMTAFVVVEISLQVSGYIFFAMSAFLSEIALLPVQMTFFEWLAMVFLFVQG
jgi:hypothetical protein